jgi:hypothetical protein
MLELAVRERRARHARIFERAARRYERAEQRVARSWHKAVRLRDELAELEQSPDPAA